MRGTIVRLSIASVLPETLTYTIRYNSVQVPSLTDSTLDTSMAQLSQSERDLVDDLLECIAEAMTDVDSVESTYANKTKLQKLLYLAIEEFDLPITYSWYLAGAVLPEDAATPQTLQSAFGRLESPDEPSIDHDASMAAPQSEPTEGDQTSEDGSTADAPTSEDPLDPVLFSTAAEDDFSVPDDPSRTDPASIAGYPRGDIVDFYRTELPNVWQQNTMRFLQNFYLEYGPAKYRDLYVQSTHLRIRLKDIEQAVEARVNGEEPATPVEQLVRQAGLDISDLHMSIREQETLRGTFDYFVKGTDLIEDALMVLAQQQPTKLSRDHVDILNQIQDFYYYYVWRYPCLAISQETATGPSAEDLRNVRKNQLDGFESTLEAEIESLETNLAQVGLQPSYSDYPTTDDTVSDAIGGLTNQYFNQ